MNFIKRNKLLVALASVALVVAILLGAMLFKRATAAAEFENKVQQQKKFFQKIKDQKIAVTQKNLKLLDSNVDKTKEQLKQLQTKLWQKTHINTRNLNRVNTKNTLREEVINMRNKLEKRGITVAESASGFSFGNILQGDTLPEEKEVPVILKQVKIINEIVDILAEHYINSVQNIERPFGLKLDKREFFNIIPITLNITGDSKAIRQVVTSLQQDSDYVFVVETIKFTTSNQAKTLMEQSSGMLEQYKKQRNSQRNNQSRSFPEMEQEAEASRAEEKSEKLPKQARKIPMTNNVTCNIQLSFLEFHKTDKSTENKD